MLEPEHRPGIIDLLKDVMRVEVAGQWPGDFPPCRHLGAFAVTQRNATGTCIAFFMF